MRVRCVSSLRFHGAGEPLPPYLASPCSPPLSSRPPSRPYGSLVFSIRYNGSGGRFCATTAFPWIAEIGFCGHGKQGKTMVMSSPVLRVHSRSFALLCFASLNTFSSFFLSFQYKMLVPYSFVYRKIRHRLYNPIRNLFSSCVDNNKLSQAPRHPLSSFVQRTF